MSQGVVEHLLDCLRNMFHSLFLCDPTLKRFLRGFTSYLLFISPSFLGASLISVNVPAVFPTSYKILVTIRSARCRL